VLASSPLVAQLSLGATYLLSVGYRADYNPPRVVGLLDQSAQRRVFIMERFIHDENIRRYRNLLEMEQNEDKRKMIQKLLAEEEAKDVSTRPEGRCDKSKIP
jgi:hypothetical protein